MKHYLKSAILLLAAVLLLGGCKQVTETITSAAEIAAQRVSGDIRGEVGTAYATQWFEFTVKSAKAVDSYAGYTPEDGYQLVDIVVSETNIFDDTIPMGIVDFAMDNDDFDVYYFALDPLDDTMMPEEFELEPGESAEYHLVYEVPEGYTELMLLYLEVDEEDNEGDLFTIYITL